MTPLRLTVRLMVPLVAAAVLAGPATLVEAAPAATPAQAAPRMKVILDTDPGDDIDDAWALAYVIASDRFDLLGVTVTHGNTPARARIAAKMLHLTGRDEVPVAVGRKTSDRVDYQFAWAEDFTAKRAIALPAADFIVEQARKYPGQVTLVAVGPLENVADAVRKESKLGKLLKRVVLMSGCVHAMAGDKACPAEWNVVASTKDAQLVYGALPLTIVPLDSTTHVQLAEAERQRVRKHDSVLTRSLEALYRLFLGSPDSRMTLHDQLAVVEAADPGAYFGKKETVKMVIDDQGKNRIDDKNGRAVEVCLEPRRDLFMGHYIDTLVAQRLGMK